MELSSALTQAELKGRACDIFHSFASKRLLRVTAIADKLDLDFALIHRKRDGRSRDAPEKMELLVGDVRDKVTAAAYQYTFSVIDHRQGRHSCG
jgi:hypothetical protein